MYSEELLEKIKLVEFEAENLPQKAQTAWDGAFYKGQVKGLAGITGASYKPLKYCGEQSAKGVNYWFIAEQISVTAKPERKIVTLGINEFNGVYGVIPTSINTVPFGY